MSVTSISRDTQNNVSIVRMISTDNIATITSPNYILNQMPNIRALNNGFWQWYVTDFIACSASDHNELLTFTDDTFSTLQVPSGSGTVTSITAGTGLSGGTITTSGTIALAAISPHTVLSNITSGSAVPVGNTISSILDLIGSTQGDILYRGASSWAVLTPGTSGQFLQTEGAGANPTWASPSGSGTVNSSTQNNLAWYAATGTTLSGLATANSSVLVTSSGGVPSFSTTLPSGLTIPGYQTTITPAALTEVNDTNITMTLGGTPSTALLQAVSMTLGWTGTLSLARGGSAANLTASAGSVVYSTASAMAFSAVGTSGQLLTSSGTGAPGWTTATYPSTTTINQLLYSSSANTITGLATLDNGVLITGTTGIPALLANGTAGYVLTANSGAPPSWQAGSSITSTEVQQQAFNYSIDSGTANIYAMTLSPVPGSYTDGLPISLGSVLNNNTGASTINVNGLGAIPIITPALNALVGGEILASGTYNLIYNSTLASFILLDSSASTGGGVTPSQIQNQSFTYSVDTGTTNTYVATPSPALTSYQDGQVIVLYTSNINTGASTLNVSGLGPIQIFGANTQALFGGEIVTGDYTFIYSGSDNVFYLQTAYNAWVFNSNNSGGIQANGARAGGSAIGSNSLAFAGTVNGNDSIVLGSSVTTGVNSICIGNALTDNGQYGSLVLGAYGDFGTPYQPDSGDSGNTYISGNQLFFIGTSNAVFSAATLVMQIDVSGNIINLFGEADQSYSLQTPSTGFSITVGNNTKTLILNPSGTLASGSVTTPALPIDGQLISIKTSQTITSFTLTANAGQTLSNSFTSSQFSAGQVILLQYNLANTEWFVTLPSIPTISTYPKFRASNTSSTVSTSGTTDVKFPFNTVSASGCFDTNSNFDPTTNFRFTPTVSGYYAVNIIMIFNGGTAGASREFSVSIYKNGSEYNQVINNSLLTTSSTINGINLSDIVFLNGSTDYIEVFYHYGTNTSNAGLIFGQSCFFSGALLS